MTHFFKSKLSSSSDSDVIDLALETSILELEWNDDVMDILEYGMADSTQSNREEPISIHFCFEKQPQLQRNSLSDGNTKNVSTFLSNWESDIHVHKFLEGLYNEYATSDVLIGLPFSEFMEKEDVLGSVAVFASHRIVLSMRSSYFRNILERAVVNNGQAPPPHQATSAKEIPFVLLPWSTFQPSTWEIVFDFMYAGRFLFQYSNPTFANDLSTAISIYGAASMVQLSSLEGFAYGSILEMLHGSFHAHISPEAYERLIGGIWTKMVELGGCICIRCIRHIPMILRLSSDSRLEDSELAQGARRALVGLFGPAWCTEEIMEMPETTRLSLLDELRKMIVPRNIFAMIFALERAMLALERESSTKWWMEGVKKLFGLVLADIDRVLDDDFRACFECPEWMEMRNMSLSALRDNAYSRVEIEEKLGWIGKSVLRAVKALNDDVVREILQPFSLVHEEVFLEGMDEMAAIWSDKISYMRVHFFTTVHSKAEDSFLESRHASIWTTESRWTTYSVASSRTVSTDYGMFYRRACLSEEFNLESRKDGEDGDETGTIRTQSRTSSVQDYPLLNPNPVRDPAPSPRLHDDGYDSTSSPSSLASLEPQTPISVTEMYLREYDMSPQTIDSFSTTYSIASSRTVSTEYGIYYTRWCLSEEFPDGIDGLVGA